MWKKYRKTAEQRMRPYVPGEDLTGVSVSGRDTPEQGGMIAEGADDGARWYISKRFFEANYELVVLGSEKDDCRVFVRHIQDHLQPGEPVVCTICGKTIDEIANPHI